MGRALRLRRLRRRTPTARRTCSRGARQPAADAPAPASTAGESEGRAETNGAREPCQATTSAGRSKLLDHAFGLVRGALSARRADRRDRVLAHRLDRLGVGRPPVRLRHRLVDGEVDEDAGDAVALRVGEREARRDVERRRLRARERCLDARRDAPLRPVDQRHERVAAHVELLGERRRGRAAARPGGFAHRRARARLGDARGIASSGATMPTAIAGRARQAQSERGEPRPRVSAIVVVDRSAPARATRPWRAVGAGAMPRVRHSAAPAERAPRDARHEGRDADRLIPPRRQGSRSVLDDDDVELALIDARRVAAHGGAPRARAGSRRRPECARRAMCDPAARGSST